MRGKEGSSILLLREIILPPEPEQLPEPIPASVEMRSSSVSSLSSREAEIEMKEGRVSFGVCRIVQSVGNPRTYKVQQRLALDIIHVGL